MEEGRTSLLNAASICSELSVVPPAGDLCHGHSEGVGEGVLEEVGLSELSEVCTLAGGRVCSRRAGRSKSGSEKRVWWIPEEAGVLLKGGRE